LNKQSTRGAPFSSYSTYSIKALKVTSKNESTMPKINMAVMIAMDNKGLRLVESNGDVEIQYVLGVKIEEAMALESDIAKRRHFSDSLAANKEFVTLAINIIDTNTAKPIYRVSVQKNKNILEGSQGQLNTSVSALLKNYPAR